MNDTYFEVTNEAIVITSYIPAGNLNTYKVSKIVIPREIFVEAYERWIAKEEHEYA